ncbi:MAG: spore coat protein [Candidatus Saccharibacteria bacterium]
MNNDYLEIENAEGMPGLADSAIALEFLLSVKTGIRNCAIAISEATTPKVRMSLRTQLDNTVNLHEELSNLMIGKGWLHPYDVNNQFQLDMKSSHLAKQIANMPLFPGDTSRLGNFATPHK